MIVFLTLFDTAERRALPVEIGLDLHAGARESRHHGSDRHALHFGDLAVGEAFEHDQKQGRALILDQRRERPLDIARSSLSGPAISGASLSSMACSAGRRASARSRLRLRLVRMV
jgi:hypothetical protein